MAVAAVSGGRARVMLPSLLVVRLCSYLICCCSTGGCARLLQQRMLVVCVRSTGVRWSYVSAAAATPCHACLQILYLHVVRICYRCVYRWCNCPSCVFCSCISWSDVSVGGACLQLLCPRNGKWFCVSAVGCFAHTASAFAMFVWIIWSEGSFLVVPISGGVLAEFPVVR